MVPLEKWTWLVKQKYSPGYKTFEVFSDYVNEPTVGDWRKPITGIVGDDRCGETPVSFPNTEVKPVPPMILHRGKVGHRRLLRPGRGKPRPGRSFLPMSKSPDDSQGFLFHCGM